MKGAQLDKWAADYLRINRFERWISGDSSGSACFSLNKRSIIPFIESDRHYISQLEIFRSQFILPVQHIKYFVA
jgi:hypothetical protein